jgi:hypothetical protein
MALRYNPTDWYWRVGVGPNVWSSRRFMYITSDDADYQAWVGQGGILTIIESQDSLSETMKTQTIPQYLTGTGLQIVSNSDSGINGTYPMDATSIALVGAVARDAACGFGLPRDLTTYAWIDLNAISHSFNATTIGNLYKAMRDYLADFNYQVDNLVHGQAGTLPSQPRTIA